MSTLPVKWVPKCNLQDTTWPDLHEVPVVRLSDLDKLWEALERAEHTMIALLPEHPRWQADGTEHDPCGLHAALACVQDVLETSPSPQGGDAPNRER